MSISTVTIINVLPCYFYELQCTQEGQHVLTGQRATNFRWDLGAT